MAKYKVEINDVNNIRDLLQEAYILADEQLIQVDREIAKLSNATQLQNEPMDARAKYAKSINDYLAIKDKAISKKLDIAKIMNEIYMHNGNTKRALEEGSKDVRLDFNKIKDMVDKSYKEGKTKDDKISEPKVLKMNDTII